MKIKNKIISVLIIVAMILPLSAINTYAATGSFSISASANQLDVNGTATITVTAKECAGQFSVASSDSSVVSVNKSGDFLDSSSATFTVTAKKAGTATITVTASDVTDTSENAVTGSKTATITVKAPQQEQPKQQEQQTQQPAQQQQTTQPAVKDPTFTNTNKTMYTTSGCNLRSSWSTSSAATSVAEGTELTVTGTSTEKVNGYVWYRVNYNGTKYIANF